MATTKRKQHSPKRFSFRASAIWASMRRSCMLLLVLWIFMAMKAHTSESLVLSGNTSASTRRPALPQNRVVTFVASQPYSGAGFTFSTSLVIPGTGNPASSRRVAVLLGWIWQCIRGLFTSYVLVPGSFPNCNGLEQADPLG